MIHSRTTWVAFFICLLVGAGAVGFLTHSALTLESREAAGVVQSESERLALWRMESLLVPLIAEENARPPVSYQSFYPTSAAYSKLYAPIGKGEVLVPSPLLTFESEFIRLHFQLDRNNNFLSPQVPQGNQRDLCEAYVCPSDEIVEREKVLETMKSAVPSDMVVACVDRLALDSTDPEPALQWMNEIQSTLGNNLTSQQKQMERNAAEFQVRSRASRQNLGKPQTALMAGPVVQDESPVPPFKPVWIGDELVLMRRVKVEGRAVVQGCWLNWPAIDAWLRGEVHDLLPEASLSAVRSEDSNDAEQPLALEDVNTLRLASLPIELQPGPAAETLLTGFTPLRLSLGTAWLGLLAASLASGFLLFAALRMSKRRGAFVSAVTHELRTPLTTFRVYTDLLGDARQTDPEKRAGYIQTLRRQAERLDHLVDNVLSYARLENRCHESRAEQIAVAELFHRAEPTLSDLADQAGMNFTLEVPDGGESLCVYADPEAVERILFNLVDNACKYGRGAERREVAISAAKDGNDVVIRVRDYGPGISRKERSRLFQEFSKSAADAARSAPGVGLGLSLSRRLARCMRGDLLADTDVADGASFTLRLPSCAARM